MNNSKYNGFNLLQKNAFFAATHSKTNACLVNTRLVVKLFSKQRLMASLASLGLIMSLVLPLATSPAYATQADREQKIDLAADEATIDQNTGAAIYTGNVKITQGSMKIRAARVEIMRRDNGSIRALVSGSPARFEQRLNPGEPIVKATADRVTYDSDSKVIKLRGNAKLDRAGDIITSDAIDLDNGSGRLKAGGEDRVRMSFTPPPTAKDKNKPTETEDFYIPPLTADESIDAKPMNSNINEPVTAPDLVPESLFSE